MNPPAPMPRRSRAAPRRNGTLSGRADPQPLHARQPRGGAAATRSRATRHGDGQRRTLRQRDAGEGAGRYPRYAYQQAPDALVEKVRALAAICERHGVPLAAAALQFSLRDPRVHATIVGMTRPERIAQTVALASYPIPDALRPELEATADPRHDDPEARRWRR